MFKLPFLLSKKEEFPNQFFALDLGGKIFKIFLLEVDGQSTKPLGFRKIAREDSLDLSANALADAVSDLKKDFPDVQTTAVVGVSGPHTLAFTTVVRSAVERDQEELTSHARAAALDSAEKELRESLGDPKLNVLELEAEILEVKEMEKLEVYLFTSFATSPYLDEQQELVKRARLSLWGFSSLPFNLVSELSDTSADGEKLNTLIFDVGGTKTEVSLVFGGELMETKSFFWEFSENVNPTVFLDLWLGAVSSTLGAFEGVETFPAKIFLSGGAAAFPGLVEAASSYPWAQDHPFEIAPEVTLLEADRLPLSLGQVALRVKEINDSNESSV
ncbi:hypothetical protein A2797_01650 [candidate division WWE3 bacterium RIFCSPHIGHO2_01_FULL_48_15]|uniref:SHS2 domain-containing protein n=1 Tax=candidate division WWE3 bacterium RIFCSPHIGHO2_01_FULL_48_15 TaxID=1802619 RepID=A0A1F4VBL0_UNCKA|nr:MAG: hypothetical protein A2797_01650 [candidate division WWE3 bacterium RIFCSPHIGHO2_01_FULL_48_15]